MCFVAIDVGSSYIKSVLFDMDQRRIIEMEKMATPCKKHHANPRVFEIDAQDLFQTVKGILEDYCSRYPGIEGVLFSTQMHGCVYSDRTFGEDIYISWQDSRCLDDMPGQGQSYMEYLRGRFPAERMANTGVEIKPALALCNLYVLLRERNFQAGADATLYTLGSYLIERLTGRNACHITNAAPMGLVDITQGAWRHDILEELGMGGIRLPEILCGFEACGRGEVGDTELTVYPDFGDQQMSVLGCCVGAGDMVLNIATAAQAILLQKGCPLGRHEVRPYFEDTYLNVVSRMPAGRNLDVFVDFIRQIGENVFGVPLSREAVWERLHDSFTLSDTQGLEADISTYELPHKLAEGAILHINHYNLTLRNMFSALLEDLGQVYARYIGELCGPQGPKGRLVFSGGTALKTPAIMRAIEEKVGVASEAAPLLNEVHAGMFRAAQVCTGRCASLDETLERMLIA